MSSTGNHTENPCSSHQQVGKKKLDLENNVPVLPVSVRQSSSSNDVPVPQTISGGQPPAQETDPAPAEEEEELKCEPCKPELDPNSPIHKLLRSPKLSYCPICNESKIQWARCPNRENSRAARASREQSRASDTSDGDVEMPQDVHPPAVKFGDLCTCGYLIVTDVSDISVDGDTAALVIQDQACQLIECHPAAKKSGEHTLQAFKFFTKNDKDVKRLYSDGSQEIAFAARKCSKRHDASTPQRLETNGEVERAIRRVCEGARCSLLQSGLYNRL